MRRRAVFQSRCDVAITTVSGPEIMPVWIDVVDQAQFDKRIALNRTARTSSLAKWKCAEVLVQALSPKTIPKHDADPKDESPLNARIAGLNQLLYRLCPVL
jgi:hypothetical protein